MYWKLIGISVGVIYWFWDKISNYLINQVLKKKDFRIDVNWDGLVRVGETVSLTVWVRAKYNFLVLLK